MVAAVLMSSLTGALAPKAHFGSWKYTKQIWGARVAASKEVEMAVTMFGKKSLTLSQFLPWRRCQWMEKVKIRLFIPYAIKCKQVLKKYQSVIKNLKKMAVTTFGTKSNGSNHIWLEISLDRWEETCFEWPPAFYSHFYWQLGWPLKASSTVVV